MPIADLLTDRVVKDSAGKDPVAGLAKDFVGRWARRQIDVDPSLGDKSKRDLTPAGTATVRPRLAADLPKVLVAYAEIAKRVAADKQHMSLDWGEISKRVESRPPQNWPAAQRKNLVATIVYQAIAADAALGEQANIERLHRICDRRLRIVERMLYDVGRAEKLRHWNQTQINAHKGGPWPDGLRRMFEYPRVPQEFFKAPCNPDDKGVCQVPMNDWLVRGVEHLITTERTNPETKGAWAAPNPDSHTDLEYVPGKLADAVAAIEKLFTPSDDYRQRNLLFCDQTIHALHLEALVFSMQKRQADRTWLDTERQAKPPGWLRLFVPFTFSGPPFLAGVREPAHFEAKEVRVADLQPGDHVVIYNHPAYDHATSSGVWRLENAVVVQTFPELRMQGHGSNIRDKAGMWQDMVDLFNKELNRRRADVDGYATVTADLADHKVRVDSTRSLRVGMPVEIADPATDAVSAAARTITAIEPRSGVVTYSGADAKTDVGQVLRHPRIVQLELELIIVDGVFIGRRIPQQFSTYSGRARRADWQILWHGNPQEVALRKEGTRLQFLHDRQMIDYVPDVVTGGDATLGFFPLWQAAKNPKKTADGKITSTDPVVILPEHIAGWFWILNPNPARQDLTAAIRPREV
jgi:hypothetical protein